MGIYLDDKLIAGIEDFKRSTGGNLQKCDS